MSKKLDIEIHANGVDTKEIMSKIRHNIKLRRAGMIETALCKKIEGGYLPLRQDEKERLFKRKKFKLGLLKRDVVI